MLFYVLILVLLGIFVGPIVGVIALIAKNTRVAKYGFVAAPVCIGLSLLVGVLSVAI